MAFESVVVVVRRDVGVKDHWRSLCEVELVREWRWSVDPVREEHVAAVSSVGRDLHRENVHERWEMVVLSNDGEQVRRSSHFLQMTTKVKIETLVDPVKLVVGICSVSFEVHRQIEEMRSNHWVSSPNWSDGHRSRYEDGFEYLAEESRRDSHLECCWNVASAVEAWCSIGRDPRAQIYWFSRLGLPDWNPDEENQYFSFGKDGETTNLFLVGMKIIILRGLFTRIIVFFGPWRLLLFLFDHDRDILIGHLWGFLNDRCEMIQFILDLIDSGIQRWIGTGRRRWT